MSELIGKVLDGRYRIESQLGTGGMGVIFRAYDQDRERDVAIKLMHDQLANKGKFRDRFLREAQLVSTFDHSNIVRILNFNPTPESLYIVMELITGGSLRDHLNKIPPVQRRLEYDDAIRLMRDIARALQYAHERNMVHRDVKPENILLKPRNGNGDGIRSYQGMLTDFGLAKLLNELDAKLSERPIGTFPYMAPEQCRADRIDHRTDMYGFGIVLYEITVGNLPFRPQNIYEALQQHENELVPPPHERHADFPPALERLILRCLAKKPNDRFQQTKDLVRALSEIDLSQQVVVTQQGEAFSTAVEESDPSEENLATNPEASAQAVDENLATNPESSAQVVDENIATNPESASQSVEIPAIGSPIVPAPSPTIDSEEVKTNPEADVAPAEAVPEVSNYQVIAEPPDRAVAPTPSPTATVDQLHPTQQDTILVQQAGHEPRVITITQPTLSIGRSPECDIIVDDPHISRLHAQLERTADGSYWVRDLVATNTSKLGGVNLVAERPTEWVYGEKLRMGETVLQLHHGAASSVVGKTMTQEQFVASLIGTSPDSSYRSSVLSAGDLQQVIKIVLAPANTKIRPEQPVTINVELFNASHHEEQLKLDIRGVPNRWATLADERIDLKQGQTANTQIEFLVPRQWTSRASRHNYTLRVRSLVHQLEVGKINGVLHVEPFYEFDTELRPTRLENRGTLRLTIQNLGNVRDEYLIHAHNREDALRFDYPQHPVPVDAGQSDVVEIHVDVRPTALVHGAKWFPIELTVTNSHQQLRSVRGN